MQMRVFLKRTLATFCLGIALAGTGCSTEPVNTVQSPDQLSGLRLPGQNSNALSPTTPTAASRIGLKNLLIWEITPPQAGAPSSYLIGTALWPKAMPCLRALQPP